MKCANCGKEFEPRTVTQKYCCERCKSQYYYYKKPINYPSITFRCSYCGKTVITNGIRDKRTRFCSQQCEKKFWRHPPSERKGELTNYHSADQYKRWERKQNEESQI